ncbi:hypothetical protein WR25_08907 [Diploscapter pachys]|uniref:Uncharacterized protein n=1 Tax=Diploscapter pachys TaxID=2018661 RepID=A0A2A2KMV1_9BILA|nr:hypothetical protein WR25_08907 [Diploscapter pachys]
MLPQVSKTVLRRVRSVERYSRSRSRSVEREAKTVKAVEQGEKKMDMGEVSAQLFPSARETVEFAHKMLTIKNNAISLFTPFARNKNSINMTWSR